MKDKRRQALVALVVAAASWPGHAHAQRLGGYGAAASDGGEEEGSRVGGGVPSARQGNLLVSWRVVSSGQGSASREGLRLGEVVVDSRRGVGGRGSIEWSSSRAGYGGQAVQQVMVMNGGRARIDVRQYSPHTVWQWAGWVGGPGEGRRGGLVNPEVQAGVVGQTVWTDSGHGLAVRPDWPGGAAPVTLELEAEAPVPRDALSRRDDRLPPGSVWTQTTLRVPLGQWVTVARTHQRQDAQRSRGAWQTETQQEGGAVLEVQVSRP